VEIKEEGFSDAFYTAHIAATIRCSRAFRLATHAGLEKSEMLACSEAIAKDIVKILKDFKAL
jgi:hypothetical protein